MSFVANYICNIGKIALNRREPGQLRPLMASYYITHQCNLFCRYCCDGGGKRFKEDPCYELNTNEAFELLEILRPVTDTLDITGGEPLMRLDLEDILSGAKKLKFRTILNTKGMGLKERNGILKQTDILVVSIDTFNADKLTQLIGADVNAAREILGTLDWLIAQRAKYKFSLVVSSVATPENLEDVLETAKYCQREKCYFHISPEIIGIKANQLLIKNPDYINLINEIINLKRKGAGIMGVRDYLEGIRDFKEFNCYPFLMPIIRPSGELYYPCMEKQTLAGNLLETKDYYQTLKKGREKWGPIPSCRNCCHIFCHMGLSLLQEHPLSALGELKRMYL
jgi:MoaA/NifB/PqqE/SkfB family radical SAM enzyme